MKMDYNFKGNETSFLSREKVFFGNESKKILNGIHTFPYQNPYIHNKCNCKGYLDTLNS